MADLSSKSPVHDFSRFNVRYQGQPEQLICCNSAFSREYASAQLHISNQS
jgi:hypothetical protein